MVFGLLVMINNINHGVIFTLRVSIAWCGLILSIILSTGCASSSNLYYWGEYEELVYNMYNKPGSATPEVQIDKLTRDIQKADSRGRPVPPGVFAHLGFMYAAVGNQSDAIASFNEEKERFPESHVLINGMMSRAYGESAVNNKEHSDNKESSDAYIFTGNDNEL